MCPQKRSAGLWAAHGGSLFRHGFASHRKDLRKEEAANNERQAELRMDDNASLNSFIR